MNKQLFVFSDAVYKYALPLLLLAIRDGKQRTEVEKAVVFVHSFFKIMFHLFETTQQYHRY